MKKMSQNDFINYISKALPANDIESYYRLHNIVDGRVELYLDFITSLLLIISHTYLGDDIMNDEDRLNHFNWCWRKNLNNFEREGIIFKNDVEIKDYLKDIIFELFYIVDKDIDYNQDIYKIINLFNKLFNDKNTKTKADLDSFIDLYSIFDESLNN
jgi:hypothetical protein